MSRKRRNVADPEGYAPESGLGDQHHVLTGQLWVHVSRSDNRLV